MKEEKKKEVWVVHCSSSERVQAFSDKEKAKRHKKKLDDTYQGECNHKIIKASIVYKV